MSLDEELAGGDAIQVALALDRNRFDVLMGHFRETPGRSGVWADRLRPAP